MHRCPEAFVDLRQACPEIECVMAYGSAANFTGAPLPGYCGPRAWLHESCLESLREVVEDLGEKGLRLRLYDAYRPKRAVRAMMLWAEEHGRQDLVEQGYLSPNSRHSKGCAVDVGLVEIESGQPLDMGTPWDAFSEKSHSGWGTGEVRRNRLLLQTPFVSRGWRVAKTEWWHFDREREGLVALDIPYGP